MVDFCKCNGTNCPMNKTCKRYTAPADELYQAWFMDVPIDKDGHCDYYLKHQGSTDE